MFKYMYMYYISSWGVLSIRNMKHLCRGNCSRRWRNLSNNLNSASYLLWCENDNHDQPWLSIKTIVLWLINFLINMIQFRIVKVHLANENLVFKKRQLFQHIEMTFTKNHLSFQAQVKHLWPNNKSYYLIFFILSKIIEKIIK